MLLNMNQYNHTCPCSSQDLMFQIIIDIHETYIVFQNQTDLNKNNQKRERNQLTDSNIFNQTELLSL